MRNAPPRNTRPGRHLIWAGLGAGVCFWVLDAVIDAYVFAHGSVLESLLSPTPVELWMRAVVGVTLLAFGAYAHLSVRRGAQMEEQLRAREVAIERHRRLESIALLAGGVAHDFNNLLTVILANTDSLLANASPQQVEALEEIRQAARTASDLTSRLLDVGRQRARNTEPISLKEVLQESRPVLERLTGDGVTLDLRVDGDLGFVRIDRRQAQQVILNLVANARDAMPNGGETVIEARNVEVPIAMGELQPGPCVRLTVIDSGIGMDEETRQRIFDPFFTTKEPGRNTGLGLASVFGIVSGCMGHIGVESSPGEGTSLTIHLPRVPPPVDTDVGGPAGSMEGDRVVRTVLVVDDTASVASGIAAMLENEGYRVVVVGGPEEALAYIDKGADLDMLLTDIDMPGISGVDLARTLRDRRGRLPVVFMTGHAEDKLDVRGLGEVIEKPFDGTSLVESVKSALQVSTPDDDAKRAS